MLAGELEAIGLEGVDLDENGYVTAALPATVDGERPAIGLIAHMDTSPDAPASGVDPIVHRDYDGGSLELPRGGTVLDPAVMPNSRTRWDTTWSARAATPCWAPTTRPAWRRS